MLLNRLIFGRKYNYPIKLSQVCDEIEHLMDDDGDMAEMYLTEKKQRKEAFINTDLHDQDSNSISDRFGSHSAPVSPVGSSVGAHKLQRAFSSISSSKHGSLLSSSSGDENIDQLEMLLEAYFVVSDSTLNKLLSVSIFLTYCPHRHIFPCHFLLFGRVNTVTIESLKVLILSYLVLQLKEYIDDTEDLINIKLVNLMSMTFLIILRNE